jgi:hypothetical protein
MATIVTFGLISNQYLLGSVYIVMCLKCLYKLCVKRYYYFADRGIGWYRVTS